MVANGFEARLKEAKNKKEFLKIIFQYPSSERAVVKRGKVIECFNDSFNFQEIIDGNVTYSYNYLVEIKSGDENGEQ